MPQPEIPTIPMPSSRRVLVVDDDRDFADSMGNLLVLEGYAVECAYAAEQVDALAERFTPQVVILDYRLGATIGLDLITPLKRRNPDIACLLSTAYSDTDTAIKALRAGVYDYFNKPLDTELFLATLDRCFEMIGLKAELAKAEKAQAEAERHEALAQVVGAVAHHFNNLFAVIQGNVEFLAEQAEAGSDQAGFADIALEALDKAASINQNLVAYTHQQMLTPEPLDIGAFLLENSEALQAELWGNVSLVVRPAPDLWTIRADRAQFKAALLCLVQNARDAMAMGGCVTITAENIETTGGDGDGRGKLVCHVMITISDTGEGVPPEIIGRVFEPFFTKHGMAVSTGLGLSRVYGFAKQSGGYVTMENNPEGGAAVRLYMPVSEDDQGVVVKK